MSASNDRTGLLHRLRDWWRGPPADAALPDAAPADADLPPTPVEWAMRVLSALFLLALVGYTVWNSLQPTMPPTFEYEPRTGELRPHEDGWVLPVAVFNSGTQSVMELHIVAELVDEADQVADEAEITLPMLGQRETEDIELWFDENPQDFELRFNVDGYSVP